MFEKYTGLMEGQEVFRASPRDLRRFLKRMGVNVDVKELENVERVIIELTDGGRYVIDSPQVTVMKIEGQEMTYVMGSLEYEPPAEEKLEEFSEEDISLVMQQTGASREEAIEALKEAGGDLAQAIIILQSKRS